LYIERRRSLGDKIDRINKKKKKKKKKMVFFQKRNIMFRMFLIIFI